MKREIRSIEVCRSEFGLKVLKHVPQANTLCLAGPCVVEIEEGEEALYPNAERHVIYNRGDDADRFRHPQNLGVEPTRFVPQPVERHGIATDVVICPRWRSYGETKNWGLWDELALKLALLGLDVFAAGAPDSSCSLNHIDADRCAWAYPRFLDATLEAMHAAKVVIATDAGLAHLAVLAGRPLLVVTYKGLVAPGPVYDSSGRKAHDKYWEAGCSPVGGDCRFEAANHTGAPIVKIDGWHRPYAVALEARRMVYA